MFKQQNLYYIISKEYRSIDLQVDGGEQTTVDPLITSHVFVKLMNHETIDSDRDNRNDTTVKDGNIDGRIKISAEKSRIKQRYEDKVVRFKYVFL